MNSELDRVVIRTMKVAVWAVVGIAVFFVLWLVADLRVSARYDDLERRVHRLEQDPPRLEAAP